MGFALAPVLTAFALFLRIQLGDGSPALLILLLPVLLTAYIGGLWPGVVCTVLTGACAEYLLRLPLNTLSSQDPLYRLDWLALVASGYLVSVLSESLHRARRRVESGNRALLERVHLLNQSYDGILVWQWNGLITFWNRGAEQMYGFTEAEAIGKTSHQLLRTTTAAGVPVMLSALERDGQWEGELLHTTQDGRRLIIESRMRLVREAGRAFVVEANRDISERKAAGDALARTQQRLETAFRLSPLGKLVVRLSDDVIVEANDAYAGITGQTHQSLLGRTLAEADPLLDPEAMVGIRRRLREGLAVKNLEVRFRRQDGTLASGVIYAELLEGAPEWHALVVLQDVTERQRAEDALRLANLDLQQFAYAAAHDLQEPTRNIATALGLFNRTYRSGLSADGDELIQESIEAAKRMHRMIRDLLAFTKAANSTSSIDTPTDANQILGQVLDNLKGAIAESDAEIVADPLPVIPVQPTHLLQLLQNLIGNAIKYRAANVAPRIHVSARREGPNWTLSVADNGIGFDSEFAEQIFGVFKRLHQAPEYAGNGIGLAICERIVRLYGGHIWAESTPGEGSTFFLTLPTAPLAIPAVSGP